MQSEFACHIGMRGKLFCRACWVKGSDVLQEEAAVPAQSQTALPMTTDYVESSDDGNASNVDSDAGSAASSGGEASTGTKSKGAKAKKGKLKSKSKGKKIKETLGQMVERVRSFMKVCLII